MVAYNIVVSGADVARRIAATVRRRRRRSHQHQSDGPQNAHHTHHRHWQILFDMFLRDASKTNE